MKKVFLFILLCGCLALSGTLKAAEGQLMAGTAKINITPKQNIPLHDCVCTCFGDGGRRYACSTGVCRPG